MPNPLKSAAVSPLMRQLVQRRMTNSAPKLTKLEGQNLTPELPRLEPPKLRPRRFNAIRPRMALQKIL